MSTGRILVLLTVVAVVSAGSWYLSSTSSTPEFDGTSNPGALRDDGGTTSRQNSPDTSGASTAAVPQFETEDESYGLLYKYDSQAKKGQFVLFDKKSGVATPLGASFDDQYGSLEAPIILTDDGHGKYIALSEGTSMQRGVSVYELPGGKRIMNGCAVHTVVFWHNVALFRDCDGTSELEGIPIYWEVGLPTIRAFDLLTGKSMVVVEKGNYVNGTVSVEGNSLKYEQFDINKGTGNMWEMDATPTIKTLDLENTLASWTR